MPKKKVIVDETIAKEPPALTPEERERQMIALAEKCAEKQLRDGTASSQIIVHYLRLATAREALEREILEKQKGLIDAKIQAYEAGQDIKELYEQAVQAMQSYHGSIESDEYEG